MVGPDHGRIGRSGPVRRNWVWRALTRPGILRLTDARRAVGSLVLDGWVPPAVEMEHVVRPGQDTPS